jgi:ATP-binding cassette subfamily F protein uup
MVLVTHDRFLMDRVSTIVLGLDGAGQAEIFADYPQWEIWQQAQVSKRAGDSSPAPSKTTGTGSPPVKKKLSYLDARELASIEQRITEAEERLQDRRTALEDPAIASDGPRLLAASADLEEAQKIVDTLYARWSELERG